MTNYDGRDARNPSKSSRKAFATWPKFWDPQAHNFRVELGVVRDAIDDLPYIPYIAAKEVACIALVERICLS